MFKPMRPVSNKRISYRIPLLMIAALVVIAGIALIYERIKPPSYYGSVIDPPKAMPGFTLQSVNGPVSLDSFRGKYVLLYFGYTSCPDICPITLATLTQALAKLGNKKAADFQVIFVSVDYKRDTPDVSNAFVKKFNTSFIGLSGTEDQINQVTKEYGIYYKLNPPDPATGYYSVDHTALVMVLDSKDELVLIWPYNTEPDQETSDMAALLSR
jgi:protein SCO1/2